MDTLTNQEFIYREVPVEYDGTGTITDIKGNTLLWNQLVQNGNFADTSKWSVSNGTLTVSNNVGTIASTGGAYLSQTIPLIPRYHKVFFRIELSSSNLASARLRIFYNYADYQFIVPNGTPIGIIETIFTVNANSGYNRIDIRAWRNADTADQSGDSFTIKNVQLVDLTALNNSAITDATSFRQFFPLPFYDYTQGKLLSFNGAGIKTTGKNLLGNGYAFQHDEATVTQTENVTEIVTPSNSSDGIFVDLLLLKGTTYHLSGTITRGKITNIRTYTDFTGTTYIDLIAGEKTSALDETFAATDNGYLRIWVASNTTLRITDFMLEIGSTTTTYQEPSTSTLSLPISDKFPDGMMSAGNVYDELTPTRYVKRVGMVDLGNISSWSLGGGGAFYDTTEVPNAKALTQNLVSSKYVTGSQDYFMNNPTVVGFSVSGTNKVRFYNSGASTSAEVITMLQGVTLNYEIDTPTEVTIDPPLDLSYPIEWGGTEQLLPENTSVPATTPILCDIDYRTMIPVNADDDPDGSGVITGTGNYRYHSMATLTATPTDEIYRFLRWEDENGDTVSTNSTYTFEVGE